MKYSYNFNNFPEVNFETTVEFNYNYYEKLETATNDNDIILARQIDLNDTAKFVNLNIDHSLIYNNKITNFHDQSLYSIVKEMDNIKLNKKNQVYFNNPNNFNDKFFGLNSDVNSEEFDKVLEDSSIDINSFTLAKQFLSENKKVIIEKNIIKETIENSTKDKLFNLSSIKNLNSYVIDYLNNLKNNTLNEDGTTNNIVTIDNDLIPIFSKMSSEVNNNFYYINVGFLIEKFLIENNEEIEDGKTYTSKCVKFFYNNLLDSNIIDPNTPASSNLNIYDTAIKYGKKYLYKIQPVFLMNFPKKNDMHLVNYCLVCDFPYFTKGIDCLEFKRPEAPSMIKFYFEENKGLMIDWNKPVEKQGDIKGYQIFKRNNLNEPYSLIGQIESHSKYDNYNRNKNVSNNLIIQSKTGNLTEFCDKSFDKKNIQLYAICSIDARGYVSNYSSQFAIDYDYNNKKCIIDLVSSKGAPLHMPNLLIPRKTKFFNNDDKIAEQLTFEENVEKVSVYITPEFKAIDFKGERIDVLKSENNYQISFYDYYRQKIKNENITINNF